jgi:hypothetical protein
VKPREIEAQSEGISGLPVGGRAQHERGPRGAEHDRWRRKHDGGRGEGYCWRAMRVRARGAEV